MKIIEFFFIYSFFEVFKKLLLLFKNIGYNVNLYTLYSLYSFQSFSNVPITH
jgi:hypothetical protein